MRRLITLFSLVLLMTGCSQVPKPTTFPLTFQPKVQAADHWDYIAKDVVKEIKVMLDKKQVYTASEYGIYVKPQPGPFGQAFTEMLISQLVQSGLKVKQEAETNSLVVQFDTQVIRHNADRKTLPFGLFTALGTGVWVAREIDHRYYDGLWDALPLASVGADIAAGSVAMISHNEVMITTSVIRHNEYLMHKTDLYYINDEDRWHYPDKNQDQSLPSREFKVQG